MKSNHESGIKGEAEKAPCHSQTAITQDSSESADPFRHDIVCFHSMFVPACMGCWQGHAARLDDQLRKLEASIALPVKERVEAIILEAVTNWFQSWKHVPRDTEGWIKNAAHSLSWDINRALPMIEQPSTSDVFQNPDHGMSSRNEPESASSSDISLTLAEIRERLSADWENDIAPHSRMRADVKTLLSIIDSLQRWDVLDLRAQIFADALAIHRLGNHEDEHGLMAIEKCPHPSCIRRLELSCPITQPTASVSAHARTVPDHRPASLSESSAGSVSKSSETVESLERQIQLAKKLEAVRVKAALLLRVRAWEEFYKSQAAYALRCGDTGTERMRLGQADAALEIATELEAIDLSS